MSGLLNLTTIKKSAKMRV